MPSKVSRSWFAVFNNPVKHGYGVDIGDLKERAKAVCDRLMAEWCVTETRVGAWAYCVKHYVGCFPVYSDSDAERKHPIGWRLAVTDEEKAKVPEDLEHVHMVLEDDKPMAFGTVKNTYAIGMHFEGTKGTRKEAEDYIAKTGDYDEKTKKEMSQPWEEVIYVARQGDIRGKQGQKSDLDEINMYLNQGLKPQEILAKGFRFYKHETAIRKAYFDIRCKDVPFSREVTVYWHYGDSGSGKSFCREQLEKNNGVDEIFYMTNFDKTSRFDGYYGQKILWIEDFKGGISFGDLLRILDVYKATFQARYANVVGLWNEVHITSIYHPIAVYNRMINHSDRTVDVVEQLLRRITCIMYHYVVNIDGKKEYKMMGFPSSAKISEMQVQIEQFEKMRLFSVAMQNAVPLGDDEELPF